jgi:hypothetical protein
VSFQSIVRVLVGLLVVMTSPAVAAAYIHFPPMTLPKMCKDSHHIRVLKVTKFDKDKRVIVFEAGEALKGEKSQVTAFRQALRADTPGAGAILDWAGEGKTAVLFYIESPPGGATKALGYVFTDGVCYSVDYNAAGKNWAVIRAEPGLTACYHGPADRLAELVKDILAGKEVTVPTKAPAAKEDRDQRNKEVNEALRRNPAGGK